MKTPQNCAFRSEGLHLQRTVKLIGEVPEVTALKVQNEQQMSGIFT